MSRYVKIVFTLVLFTVSACIKSPTAPPRSAKPGDTFDLQKLRSIDSVIAEARTEKRLPGGVLWVERNGIHFTKAYGKASMKPDTIPGVNKGNVIVLKAEVLSLI